MFGCVLSAHSAVLCILVTSVLRFALLPYYRRNIIYILSPCVIMVRKECSKEIQEIF